MHTRKTYTGICILVHVLGTKCFVLGSPVNRGGWSSGRQETSISQPAAIPCTEISPNRTAAFGPSLISLPSNSCLRVNGFHAKEERICTEDQGERDEHRNKKNKKLDGFLFWFLVLYRLFSPERSPLHIREYFHLKKWVKGVSVNSLFCFFHKVPFYC